MNLNHTACIKILIIIAISIVHDYNAHTQSTFKLKLIANNVNTKVFNKISYKTYFKDKREISKELQNIWYSLIDEGYIAARFDSISGSGDTTFAYLTTEKKYDLAYLGNKNIDHIVWKQFISRKEYVQYDFFRYNEVRKLFEKILTYYENRGYPFASIGFDSLEIANNSITALINVDKKEKFLIDSIIIKGNAKIRSAYIYNYLGIKPGDSYNESKIKKISQRIEEITFLQEHKPFEVTFTENGAWLYLYLDKKKASKFDGILGFMPNSETNGKLLLTGDVSLLLSNSLRWGEMISFNWRKLEVNSQDLRLKVIYPFILSSPFILDYDFHLFKKDTLYYTVNNILGVQYHFTGINYLKIFIDYWNSSLLSTYGLEFANKLPEYADIKTQLYGIHYHLSHLDNIYNPFKGYHIDIITSAGNKHIRKNENINKELYNDLDLSSVQYKLLCDIGVFIPIARKSTLWLRTQNAYLDNEELFENELFRIGGMRILRGFDEESIYSSLYSVLTVEFRYLFEKNSFINLFWNGAYYEKNTRESFVKDTPFGFGAGINFETKAGIFSLNYALGKQFDNPIDLKSAKIHFGILSTF